tara:strand:+ start:358 stop:606 length:249 start_codon:yes stop_codon:yes gene_type:complete
MKIETTDPGSVTVTTTDGIVIHISEYGGEKTIRGLMLSSQSPKYCNISYMDCNNYPDLRLRGHTTFIEFKNNADDVVLQEMD